MANKYSELEERFGNDMIYIYNAAREECNYNASRFLQMIYDKGGLAAARQLIRKTGEFAGLIALYDNKRLDLSVEAYVLKPEYAELFTEEEKEICRKRLHEYEYDVSL